MGLEQTLEQVKTLADPTGAEDDMAEVATHGLWIFVCEHICFDVAEGGVWFLANTVIERLENVLLKVRGAGVFRNHSASDFVRVLGILYAQDIHFDACG